MGRCYDFLLKRMSRAFGDVYTYSCKDRIVTEIIILKGETITINGKLRERNESSKEAVATPTKYP